MSALSVALTCGGCGATVPEGAPGPFRCPRAGRSDDVDHVLTVVVDPAVLRFPEGGEPNPFIRYRSLFYAYHLARARGMSDADYMALVERLDAAVASADGRPGSPGFVVTPFRRSEVLAARLGLRPGGGVWVKDETGNVSGSHKARHLMGVLIYLEVAAQTGLAEGASSRGLAIASCGNAALAAAVVARAGGRRLEVFIPEWADPQVVARLEALGAHLTVCPRQEAVGGDPTYHRLQAAIRNGALPFTCQGPENGLAVEGGKTLGYEIVSGVVQSAGRLDRLFVQVGGGALASACVQAMEDAVRLGEFSHLPRIHAVQTEGGHPLKRAYDLVARRVLDGETRDVALRYAATHRSQFMWPWEREPRSRAHGILDDETYDWLAVIRGMLASHGEPIVVSEADLEAANTLGRATGIKVDHTGSAGLAGALRLHQQGRLGPEERIAVLFTGATR